MTAVHSHSQEKASVLYFNLFWLPVFEKFCDDFTVDDFFMSWLHGDSCKKHFLLDIERLTSKFDIYCWHFSCTCLDIILLKKNNKKTKTQMDPDIKETIKRQVLSQPTCLVLFEPPLVCLTFWFSLFRTVCKLSVALWCGLNNRSEMVAPGPLLSEYWSGLWFVSETDWPLNFMIIDMWFLFSKTSKANLLLSFNADSS